MKIKIGFSKKDYHKVWRAIRRAAHQANVQTRMMPRRCSMEAAQLLRGNINKQAFSPYKSHTDRYAKWKRTHGYPSTFWKLSGDLIMAIKSHRLGHRDWMAGISGSAMDSGGKSYGKGRRVPIGMYAKLLEYGSRIFPGVTQRHPARPVFRPTAIQYRQGLMLKQADRSLKKIGSKWR